MTSRRVHLQTAHIRGAILNHGGVPVPFVVAPHRAILC